MTIVNHEIHGTSKVGCHLNFNFLSHHLTRPIKREKEKTIVYKCTCHSSNIEALKQSVAWMIQKKIEFTSYLASKILNWVYSRSFNMIINKPNMNEVFMLDG